MIPLNVSDKEFELSHLQIFLSVVIIILLLVWFINIVSLSRKIKKNNIRNQILKAEMEEREKKNLEETQVKPLQNDPSKKFWG
ncbi:MAG TPA: hypothetical protein VHO90_21960 [Bacteroidales bacterium]|jgi:K+ transporter|nr:hypothetical protein [Bacteroidales bacterium]